MRILGIETSCDETAASVVEDRRDVLSSVVASQLDTHGKYGGVVPELASREHLRAIVPVVRLALEEARTKLSDLAAIAVTEGPGLVGSLLVGMTYAKSLCFVQGLPLIGVNHIEGHLLSIELDRRIERPFLGLVVSGGHSALYWAEADGSYRLLGRTRDDAAGEAFDKAAKLLGLGYPGGRAIEQAALSGDPNALQLPRPRVRGAALDLSFSGLKTALWQKLEREPGSRLEDVAASFQQTIVEILVDVTRRAIAQTGATCVVVTGGVSANQALRQAMERMAVQEGALLLVPPLKRCTDNAAMIAYAGWRRLARGERDPLTLNARADLPLGARSIAA